jgi:hypothetical protein
VISTLDVTSAGTATLEADWTTVARNPTLATRRRRSASLPPDLRLPIKML